MSGKQKILIVDDEPINIDLLSGLLKPHYALLVAKSGERAIKAAETGKPDLILLDIMMPDMDGYEVCRRLKSVVSTRRIPVIFITAMSQVEDEAKGLQIGAADYITKPISPSIVMARVKTQLELVRREQQLQSAYSLIKSQKDRMAEELNIGRDIQMNMMPVNFSQISRDANVDLHAHLVPARELGGDFYDFFLLDNSTLCLCVGDVSGKGVPAALFMAVTKTLIRNAVENSRSTADAMSEVNNTLAAGNEDCMFVTLFLAICNTETGEVTYTNAGHNPPYVVHPDGELLILNKRHGPVVGAMPGVAYRNDQLLLDNGDALFMFTDGITEAHNHTEVLYGEERLANILASSGNACAESINKAVMADVDLFMGSTEQADDITILSYRNCLQEDFSAIPVSAHRLWQGLDSTIEVNEWFDGFAMANHIDEKVRRKLNMFIDDLIMNIISYAFSGEDNQEIEVGLVIDAGKIEITFIDNGRPFNPFEEAKPDTSPSITDREVGGLGIHLSREMADDASYQRKDECNVVKLVLNLPDYKIDADGGLVE